jgi:anti-sigma B factor antagonist
VTIPSEYQGEPSEQLPPPDLEVDLLVRDGVAVVVADGEIDLATRERFEACLESALAGREPILIDLCDVSFVDSSGLRALLHARSRSAADDRALGLVCPPDGVVARLLQISGTATAFTVHATRETALEAMGDA